ncbi:MAG: hypothetical protein ACRD18_05705 [Terriglobia bacterium]
MSDTKKPHNAANAMFGLDDVPVKPNRPQQPQDQKAAAPSEVQRPAADKSASPYGPAQSPSVSFGPGRLVQTPPAETAQPVAAPRGEYSESDPSGRYQARGPQEATRPPGPPPQYVYVPTPPSSSTGGWMKWLLGILLVVAVVALVLALTQRAKFSNLLTKQADQINSLTRRADSSDDRYAQLSAKFQVTAERLGLTQKELGRARQLASNIEKQQQQSVRQLNAAIAEKASATQVNQLQSNSNQKFGQLSGSIAGTQKDLDATKEALTGAKGELSGAIARTHSELVALAHRTDRDYFEFHVNKRSRQRIGSLQVQLLKTSTKHNLFTVNLFFDDKVSQLKNEAIDEPVFFYMEGAQSALEMVVNKLGKNTISGYISAPKGFIPNASNVLTARPNS